MDGTQLTSLTSVAACVQTGRQSSPRRRQATPLPRLGREAAPPPSQLACQAELPRAVVVMLLQARCHVTWRLPQSICHPLAALEASSSAADRATQAA